MLPRLGGFVDPESYLRRRGGRGWRQWSEHRALSMCLRGLPVRVVCDCPCGPGRVFGYWRRRDYSIIGVDISPPMVSAAREVLLEVGAQGRVVLGDVNELKRLVPDAPDLVASIRFAYYFDEHHRLDLLDILASVSRRYVLVQYKTGETWKGRRQISRGRNRDRYVTSYRQMADEFRRARLRPLVIQAVGAFSDRVFVLGEKTAAVPGTAVGTRPRFPIR